MVKVIIFCFAMMCGCSAWATALELRSVNHDEAVCNNNKQANYWIAEQESNKWLIQLPGGGAAWNENSYKKRPLSQRAPAKPSQNKYVDDSAVAELFYRKGFNIILFNYCSSDLYAGNHVNNIEGQPVPFKGRVITKTILAEYSEKLSTASDVVVAGTSAGVYGIVLNLDLFSIDKKPRVILDSIWRDEFQQSLREPQDNWSQFPLGELPKHCQGDFYKNCSVNRVTLQKHGISEAFIIYNYGDPYNWAKKKSHKNNFAESVKADAKKFGGGYSVDAKKFKLRGAEKWGHGLLSDKEFFNKKINGKSLYSLIDEWIDGGNPVHIAY